MNGACFVPRVHATCTWAPDWKAMRKSRTARWLFASALSLYQTIARVRACFAYGSVVPAKDFTRPMSVALMLPLAFTSPRKLLCPMVAPESALT